MVAYNSFGELADNAEFLEFIRAEFGIDDVAKISPIEQHALLMSFNVKIGNRITPLDASGPDEHELALKVLNKEHKALLAEKIVYIAFLRSDNRDKDVQAIFDEINRVRPLAARENNENNLSSAAHENNLFTVKIKKPSHSNNGIGSVDIAHATDDTKNEYIAINNCTLSDEQIIGIYDYLQKNPQITGAEVAQALDGQLAMWCQTQDGKEMRVNLSELAAVENEDLQAALEQTHTDTQPEMESRDDINIGTGTIVGAGDTENENEDNSRDNDLNSNDAGPIRVGGFDGNGNENEPHEDDDLHNIPNDNDDERSTENVLQPRRVRSANSDRNDHLWDCIRLQVMVEKKYIKAEDVPENPEEHPEQVIEVLQKHKLTEKQNKDVNNTILDTFVRDQELFEVMPPSKLAEAYAGYDERIEDLDKQIAKEKDENKKQELEIQKNQLIADSNRVEKRIDELTDMLVADTHQSRDLFFGDVTNIADTYDGYNKMFEVRKAVLNNVAQNGSDTEKQAAQGRIQKLEDGGQALQDQYDEYLDTWNLKDVDENSAKGLDERYEALNEGLKNVTLDAETAQIVSNFKFLDASGDSKLDKAITLSKQLFIQANLGTTDELTPEFLQQSVKEYLLTTLHIMHEQDVALKDVIEHPRRFTEPQFRADFINQLANVHQPMFISDIRFKAAQQSMVNMAHGYRGVLAKQLKDQNAPVVNKICNNIKHLDARAAARTVKTVNKDTVWRDYASNTLQGMAAAAIGTARVKGAMMLGAAMVSGATGIAAGTVMMAASSVVPVALSFKQYMSWRKEQKAEGKPTGFKAMFKDRNLMAAFATTALTEIAVGAALVPGGQPIAVIAGGAALAFGVGRAATHDYKNLREAGKGKLASGAAALCGAILKVGTAYLTNKGMEAMANRLGLFQEQHKVKDEVEEKSHIEQKETPELVAKAHHTLETMYKGNEAGLENDLAQVKAQLHAMGRDDISPEVFLRNACDAGMNTGTNTMNHVDGGGFVHTHGNNTVLTESWSQQHGMDHNLVRALGDIRGADGQIHITPQALAGHDAIKLNISIINEVGSTIGSQAHHDGVLHRNAEIDADGRTVHSDTNADRFDTYADFKNNGYIEEKVIDVQHQEAVYENRLVDTPLAAGMYGIRKKPWINKLVDRAGSLLDKIIPFKRKAPKPSEQDTIILPPPTDKGPEPKPILTPVPKKPYTPPYQVVKPSADKLLLDEFQMVYGFNPAVQTLKGDDGKFHEQPADPKRSASYVEYAASVEKERVAAGGKPMEEFLQERRERYLKAADDKLDKKERIELIKDPVTHPFTNEVRQSVHTSSVSGTREWSFEYFIEHTKGYKQPETQNQTKRDISRGMPGDVGKGKDAGGR